jgi:uncharacterized membrane protein SpoIIM required for sporulation
MKLMPTLPKQRNAYVEYMQTRNSIIVIVLLAFLLTVAITVFTVLYNVLYPRPDNWFMWPLWIFYAIAISIGFSKAADLYKKYMSLNNELAQQNKQKAQQQLQQQQQQSMNTTTSPVNINTSSDSTFTEGPEQEMSDVRAEKQTRNLLNDNV